MTVKRATDKQTGYNSNVRPDILSFVEERPTARVLEIGCGRGNSLAYLNEKGYASYLAPAGYAGRFRANIENYS